MKIIRNLLLACLFLFQSINALGSENLFGLGLIGLFRSIPALPILAQDHIDQNSIVLVGNWGHTYSVPLTHIQALEGLSLSIREDLSILRNRGVNLAAYRLPIYNVSNEALHLLSEMAKGKSQEQLHIFLKGLTKNQIRTIRDMDAPLLSSDALAYASSQFLDGISNPYIGPVFTLVSDSGTRFFLPLNDLGALENLSPTIADWISDLRQGGVILEAYSLHVPCVSDQTLYLLTQMAIGNYKHDKFLKAQAPVQRRMMREEDAGYLRSEVLTCLLETWKDPDPVITLVSDAGTSFIVPFRHLAALERSSDLIREMVNALRRANVNLENSEHQLHVHDVSDNALYVLVGMAQRNNEHRNFIQYLTRTQLLEMRDHQAKKLQSKAMIDLLNTALSSL